MNPLDDRSPEERILGAGGRTEHFPPKGAEQADGTRFNGAGADHGHGAGAAQDQDSGRDAAVPWPDPLGLDAYYGLAGEFVTTLIPHTESDPAALLFQFLAFAGNAVGSQPHYIVEGDHHAGNLFVVVVGDSAKARKGTSLGRIKQFFKLVDETWVETRVASGLSTGEGLIYQVRNEVIKPDEKTGDLRVVDPGESDKRFLAVASEYATTFAVMSRAGNTLSPVLRDAWDSRTLRTLTKASPLTATNPHVSVIAHITISELLRCVDDTTAANGYCNRHLFICARRSKLLPHGGGGVDLAPLVARMQAVLEHAARVWQMQFDQVARAEWERFYQRLSEPRPGLLGAVVARGEAQTIRLAVVYALLDRDNTIRLPHLRAAAECWRYAEASAAHVFGNALGDPVADAILEALRQSSDGLTRTDMLALFGRNVSSARIQTALALLLKGGLARQGKRPPAEGGRKPAEVWHAAGR